MLSSPLVIISRWVVTMYRRPSQYSSLRTATIMLMKLRITPNHASRFDERAAEPKLQAQAASIAYPSTGSSLMGWVRVMTIVRSAGSSFPLNFMGCPLGR